MYCISLNIISKRNVINPTPYMFVSDELNSILFEIRKLISDIVFEQFDKNGTSMRGYKISMMIWSSLPGNVHIVDINCNNLKDIQQLIIEQNAKNKYIDIMGNFGDMKK